MKRCYKCEQVKQLTAFSIDNSRADGLQPRCKACYSAYKASRRKPRVLLTDDQKKANVDAWRKKNRDRCNELAAEWRAKNKEKVDESIAKYRAANPGRLQELRSAWREKNRDKLNEQARAASAANPGRSAAHTQRRNAKKKQASPAWADPVKINMIYEDCAIASAISGIEYEVDHIVPLTSNSVCGLHNEFNLQILTQRENASKGNRYWPDMPGL